MNNYGLEISDFLDDQNKCIDLLGSYLKQGCLGLKLGAGASNGLDLPSWKILVRRCVNEKLPGKTLKSDPDNSELKKLSDEVKAACVGSEYIQLIKSKLYEGVKFDFQLAKKDLLIALTSLLVGKTRGNVNHVVTYNFDSVLEWYLKTNGLSVNVSRKSNLLTKVSDVEVTHLHGFLPHDDDFGEPSDSIVFSKEEFEDRQVQYDYWKVVMEEFYRRHIFLTVGLSPESIIDDVCPYLRSLNTWYEQQKLLRDQPYGVAFITPNSDAILAKQEKEKLIKHGIIPCTINIPQIPPAIFKIAQSALIK